MYGLLGEPERRTVGDVYWMELVNDVDLGASQASEQGDEKE